MVKTTKKKTKKQRIVKKQKKELEVLTKALKDKMEDIGLGDCEIEFDDDEEDYEGCDDPYDIPISDEEMYDIDPEWGCPREEITCPDCGQLYGHHNSLVEVNEQTCKPCFERWNKGQKHKKKPEYMNARKYIKIILYGENSSDDEK